MTHSRFPRFTARRHALGLVVSLATAALPLSAGAADLSYESIVGRPQGLKITVHQEMALYLEALAERSPLVKVIDQGESWEGKRLLLAVVTSEANHQRLNEIRENARKLADPRGLSASEAAAIIDTQPAIAWLGGSIHGFELSGAEGVLRLLEHLVTRDDEETRKVLDDVVVLLDPMLNPDGRDAFAHHNHARLGSAPNPERDDWGNDFNGWEAISFRTGHYFFDTNRDWWAHTQRETQARVPTFRAWRPQVVVDLHEMGSNVEFYFDPATDPYGPFFPDFARRWFTRFGKAYARAFDQAGFEYMTRERYNYFYPGYTTSYGSYQGAVGMLYEQGSSRGLAITRADDSVRTLTDAFGQQYTAAWAAVRLAAEKRSELLTEYVAAHREAIEEGKKGTVRYLFGPGGDPRLVSELAALLERNGVEVGRLSTDAQLSGVRDRTGASVGRRRFPAGTWVVEAAQPRNRLIRVLLEPDLPISEAFLEQARERLDRGGNPRFYDITAWSLPLLFNVEGYSTTDATALQVTAEPAASPRPFPEAPAYGWVIDGNQTAGLAVLYHLKTRGHRGSVVLKPSRVGERTFAGGSIVIRAGQNSHVVGDDLRELAERYGVDVAGVDSGLSEEGFPSLGSGDDSFVVKEPKIAILAEQPVHGYSFGWTWYTLDQQYGIRTTPRRVSSMGSTPLDDYNVLVLPHLFTPDGLAGLLGESGIERIKDWTRDGGTLVALGASVDFVREHLELTALGSFYDQETGDGDETEEAPHKITAPGAIVRVDLEEESWLASGYSGSIPSLVTSNRVFLEPEGPPASD
ncbi:MAG: M14 family zinc carboxypeptidase, partial [Thermoanaerobaculia bacterium]